MTKDQAMPNVELQKDALPSNPQPLSSVVRPLRFPANRTKAETFGAYLDRLEHAAAMRHYRGHKNVQSSSQSQSDTPRAHSPRKILPSLLPPSDDKEDDDDERAIITDKAKIVDWIALSDSPWGQDALAATIPKRDMISLVGWATHLNGASIEYPVLQPPNHLLALPSIPPRPIHLEYLENEVEVQTNEGRSIPSATKKNNKKKKRKVFRCMWQTRAFRASEEPANKRSGKPLPYRKYRPQDWQQWQYNKNDETYKLLLSSRRQHKKKVTVTVPIEQKEDQEGGETATTSVSASPVLQNWFNNIERSAQVAVGMLVEEALTASLVPLAQAHVERCRYLDAEQAFDEWTLPPTEAILRIPNGGSTWLPSATKPITSGKKTPQAIRVDIVDNWCKARGLDHDEIRNNMDVFSRLLPCPPSAL